MVFSFSINSKPQPNSLRKKSDAAETDSSTINYVTEFGADEAPPPPESRIKPIAPIPNTWCPNKKLKTLPTLLQLPQSNGAGSSLEFEVDPRSNVEAENRIYGLVLRQPSATVSDVRSCDRGETISDLELRKLREDLEKLPEAPGVDEYENVPVEGFAENLLAGYGWKEGRGVGRNAKVDVKVYELTKKSGRGGIGFMGELPENRRISTNGNAGEDKKGFGVGKEVRIVNGRETGMKSKIVEVRSGGNMLVLRMLKSNEKVKIQTRDVAEVGSIEEESCLRELKALKAKEKDVNKDKKDRDLFRKRERQDEENAGGERVNWLRNHIRVRIISEELKGGRLFLKKGVVMDVLGPGVCDISFDESKELVQGVGQELLEPALPKCGRPVVVLYGRYKGAFGSLLKRDPEKEMGVVRDADTHQLLNVKLEQIAEYMGDPSYIGY